MNLWAGSDLCLGLNMANSSYPQTSEFFKKKLSTNCKIGCPGSGVILSKILRCDAVSIG